MTSKRSVKLLLLGTGESGKSTVVKQMRIIHQEGFNRDDYIRYRGLVQGNVVTSMATIVKAMKSLFIFFDNPDREQDAAVVLQAEAEMDERKGIPLKVRSLPPHHLPSLQRRHQPSPSLAQVIEACRDLWSDAGVQQTFSRGPEYNLWDCAKL